MVNFQSLPTVEDSQFYIDKAFSRAKKRADVLISSKTRKTDKDGLKKRVSHEKIMVVHDNLIKDLTVEYNTTTVVVSHDMNSVMEIGDYIMFMFEGHKVWDGAKDEIIGADEKAFNDFVFANNLMRTLKEQMK